MTPLQSHLTQQLQQIQNAGLLRHLKEISPRQSVSIVRNSRPLINFSSNDYLGLATHPALIEAACSTIQAQGAGSGASRLISGTLPAHSLLEEQLAAFKGTQAALTFSSGYAAATGTIPALVGPADVIILDKLAHACLIDGARLSGATIRVFLHNNLNSLASRLSSTRKKFPSSNILIIVEAIYSMDGDLAPLREIVHLKDRFGAWLLCDEAHSIGVIGPQGRGLSAALHLNDHIEIHMGTLGKALGSSGAYIAGSHKLRDLLINRARSFIFSTAPPPASAAAASAALKILTSPEGLGLLQRLRQNIETFAPAHPSAICPIILGEESAALRASASLENAGFLVPAIRFPAVAKGQARLRVSLSAAHDQAILFQLQSALSNFIPPKTSQTNTPPHTNSPTPQISATITPESV